MDRARDRSRCGRNRHANDQHRSDAGNARRLLARARAEREPATCRSRHRQGGDTGSGGNGGLFAGEIAPDQISEQDALAALRPLLEDAGVLKIGQDLKFDLQMFALRGITLAPYDDVMLLSYVLDAGRSGHGIDDTGGTYLGHTAIDANALKGSGKSRITFDHVPIEQGRRMCEPRSPTWRCGYGSCSGRASPPST